MFKMNKIPIGMKELTGLFYKNSPKNKFLDFSKLVEYSISGINDENYRSFMRNFKINKSLEATDTFVPMNFRLLLEHFNTKGKLRENVEQVKSAMKKMEILTNFKKNQLNSPIKSVDDKVIERETKIHKQIDLESIYKNFTNVLNISEQNIDKVMKQSLTPVDTKLPKIKSDREEKYLTSIYEYEFNNPEGIKSYKLKSLKHNNNLFRTGI